MNDLTKIAFELAFDKVATIKLDPVKRLARRNAVITGRSSKWKKATRMYDSALSAKRVHHQTGRANPTLKATSKFKRHAARLSAAMPSVLAKQTKTGMDYKRSDNRILKDIDDMPVK